MISGSAFRGSPLICQCKCSSSSNKSVDGPLHILEPVHTASFALNVLAKGAQSCETSATSVQRTQVDLVLMPGGCQVLIESGESAIGIMA